jgi:hypothetical protein
MIEIIILEGLHGYQFKMDGNVIHYTHEGERPDPSQVRPLLEAIKAKREEAIRFLQTRNESFDSALYLLEAAEKAQESAKRAESVGNLDLARQEWKRFARLFAAGAEMAGADDPYIPWPEFVRGFDGV